MSTSAPTGRAKRSRSTNRQPKAKPTTPTAPRTVSAAERHAMIAETAYLRAEARGFNGGDPLTDWLASEREVDALLGAAENSVGF